MESAEHCLSCLFVEVELRHGLIPGDLDGRFLIVGGHHPWVREETARRLEVAHELFDGLLEARLWGADPYLSLWDPISTWMGVEGALFALIDRPVFVHKLVVL